LTSDSDRRRTRRALASIALLIVSALAFYVFQNRYAPVGGSIAPAKLAWLAFAILFWIVLPAFIALDGRVPETLRQAFATLFVLMVARGVVELWMLYVTLGWSPWYGIAHDVVCLAAIAVCALRAQQRGAYDSPFGAWMGVHLAVTAAMFLPEIYFAHYMVTNFATTGEGAIYFVPGDPRHQTVLQVTATAAGLLAVYAPVFLRRWLVGTPDRAGTPAL